MPPEHQTAIDLRRLLRDNEADAGVLDALRAEISAVCARPGSLGAEAAAYLAVKLHAWYTAFESILERIARVVEGGLPGGPSHHQDLLRGMALPLAAVAQQVGAGELLPERELLREGLRRLAPERDRPVDEVHLPGLRIGGVAGEQELGRWGFELRRWVHGAAGGAEWPWSCHPGTSPSPKRRPALVWAHSGLGGRR